jgi:hypothetical protein
MQTFRQNGSLMRRQILKLRWHLSEFFWFHDCTYHVVSELHYTPIANSDIAKINHDDWKPKLEQVTNDVNKKLSTYQNVINIEYSNRISKQEAKLKDKNYSYSELLHLTTRLAVEENSNSLLIECLAACRTSGFKSSDFLAENMRSMV